MKLWFSIVKALHNRYGRVFAPISPSILVLFNEYQIDLQYMRYCNEVLSTKQVDAVLDDSELDIVQRIALKNMLVQEHLMELREYPIGNVLQHHIEDTSNVKYFDDGRLLGKLPQTFVFYSVTPEREIEVVINRYREVIETRYFKSLQTAEAYVNSQYKTFLSFDTAEIKALRESIDNAHQEIMTEYVAETCED